MQVNADIKIASSRDENVAILVKKIEAFFTENVGNQADIQCQLFTVDIPAALSEARKNAGFTEGGDVELIEDLREEFKLDVARFVFRTGPAGGFGSSWEYCLLTDHGLEFIGSLQQPFTTLVNTENYAGLPKAMPLLMFFGKDPDEEVLEKFRSGQYVWHALRHDVNRDVLFSLKGLDTLWNDIDRADSLFEPAELLALASETTGVTEEKCTKQVPDNLYQLMMSGLTSTPLR